MIFAIRCDDHFLSSIIFPIISQPFPSLHMAPAAVPWPAPLPIGSAPKASKSSLRLFDHWRPSAAQGVSLQQARQQRWGGTVATASCAATFRGRISSAMWSPENLKRFMGGAARIPVRSNSRIATQPTRGCRCSGRMYPQPWLCRVR